jgi:hypothetical protein
MRKFLPRENSFQPRFIKEFFEKTADNGFSMPDHGLVFALPNLPIPLVSAWRKRPGRFFMPGRFFHGRMRAMDEVPCGCP